VQDLRLDLAAFALEHAPDILAVVDPAGNLAWLGGATAKLGAEVAIGRPLLDYVHPDDVVQALGALAEASSKPGFHQASVIRMKRDDDRLVRLRVTASTVPGTDGDWLVLCGRGEDDDLALELRRRELGAAVARVSDICAGARWYELHSLVPASIEQVASIVGADRIELVTATDGRGGEQEAAVALVWAADGHVALSPTRFVADPEDLRTQPCVRSDLGERERTVAEVWYDAAHGGSGVVRMHFPAGFRRWEDANSDHLRALGSVLASTAHRCGEEEQSHHHATRDSLTGLLNRRGLLRETAAWHGTEELEPVAVVFVDLNGFKAVNDTLGHGTGDDVLRAAGDALRQAVRADDLVARLGGDEFVVAIRAAREDAADLAERIRRALDSVGDSWPGISAAVGVSIGGPDSDVVVQDLIARADAAMYADKRAQLGRVHRT
jgi:diguanylate cyclase (GGDEF)-like protein